MKNKNRYRSNCVLNFINIILILFGGSNFYSKFVLKLENMTQELERMLNELKEGGFPLSKIENDLGFSNGLLGKAKKGDTNLSDEKMKLLTDYYFSKIKVTVAEEIIETAQVVPEFKETNGNHVEHLVGVEPVVIKKKTVPQNEKMKALRLAIDKIDKDYGKGLVMMLGDEPVVKAAVISTGSLGLDIALGIGGLPKGRITEIYGPESSGKTTIALHVISEAQKMGDMCAFIDAEHAFDSAYAKNIGVDVDTLYVSQPDYGEQALEIADRLILSGGVGVIVIDSVAALVPKSELEGEMGDSKMGLHARLMSQACRKLTASISKTNTVVIFINQLRSKIGIVMGNPEVTTGGNALKFYSSIRLDVRKIATLADGELQYGNRTKVKVVKNKCAPPFKITEFDIIFGKGIDRTGELLDVSVNQGVVKKAGSWYSFNENKLGQGRSGVIDLLNDHPDMLKEIKDLLNK